jgi:saccharopine dehydrogenase-like NADP-dependent oxidoreductase
VVRGARQSVEVEEMLDCQTAGIAAWGVGVDADTGCPPSIAVQLLRAGTITARGVIPPERAIPAAPFFAELERRGMRITRRRRRANQAYRQTSSIPNVRQR